MNKHAFIEQKLGFDSIREMLKEECISNAGQHLVDKMVFSKNAVYIKELLEQADEFRRILLLDNQFPEQNYFDLLPELKHLHIEGTFILPEVLFDMKCSLITIFDILKFLLSPEEQLYPALCRLAEPVDLNPEILRRINLIIDDRGEIYDSASPELRDIRKSMNSRKAETGRLINRIMGVAKREGWTAENVEVSVRNGRLTIPVSSSHKRKIKGFVQDESATGETSYIEPAEVVELNNEIRELEIAEKREIIRILTEFTHFLRPYLPQLEDAYKFLGKIDFIRAKARLALKIEAGKPIVLDKPLVYWFHARHPLLYLSLKKHNRQIVPLKIELNDNQRILIISGPNAGGKSVCLKTVGLLQYMMQCGLLVPLSESSEMGIFENIFVNIGDQQSLEDDLSTYSSHLLDMKNLLSQANQKTLFLIDEFGTGTDPQVGGAIAEAILEKLNNCNSFGVVTTHYSNLKLMSDTHSGIVNGAMLYDMEKMKPLYRLSIGNPGSSFAFEIAQNIGLQKEIIEKAIEKAGQEHLRFEQQLQQLEIDKLEIDKRKKELRLADDLLAEVLEKYNKLTEKLENNKHEIMAKAKAEAKELLRNSNKIIENTIAEIKANQADKEKVKQSREKLQKFEKELHKEEKKPNPEKTIRKPQHEGIKIDYSPITVGDYVKYGEQKTIYEVAKIKNGKVEIFSNMIKMNVALQDLVKVDKKSLPKQESKTTTIRYDSILNEINEKKASFSEKIDLRGKRVDEAVLLSVKEVYILHGRGNGILKHVIRDYLRTFNEVESLRDEHIERGGDGITIVKLR